MTRTNPISPENRPLLVIPEVEEVKPVIAKHGNVFTIQDLFDDDESEVIGLETKKSVGTQYDPVDFFDPESLL